MAEENVSHVKEKRWAPAGVRGSPTPSIVKNVERRWQPILVNLDEMASQEVKNILKRKLPKTRKILSSGCIHFITTKGGRMLNTP